MYIQRILDLKSCLSAKSHFLFGPRQTGKSSLIEHIFQNKYKIIDLLKTDVYLELQQSPSKLENMIPQNAEYIIIDEIQRVPELLNEVHRLIEKKKIKFLLTGSSARKLRRSGVNLLAGRAWKAELFPLVSAEIPQFDLNKYLLIGGLPSVYLSKFPEKELHAYVDIYLKEEIQTEAVVRKLPAFIKFLNISAISSGQKVNFSNIAQDIQVAPNTVREFYSILEDTLLGFNILPYRDNVSRKTVSFSKFYYFDIGVRNILSKIYNIPEKTDFFGQAFEHFIAQELRAYLSYYHKRHELYFWHTQDNYEVDFVIGNELGIEVKSTERITSKHLKTLKMFDKEKICKSLCVVSLDKNTEHLDNIKCFYWKDFLEKLWSHQIL